MNTKQENIFQKVFFVLGLLCLVTAENSNDTDGGIDVECSAGSSEDEQGNKKIVTCLQVDHPSGLIILKVRMYKNNARNYEQIVDPRELIQETNCSIEMVNTANNCTIRVDNQQFLDIHDAFATLYSIDAGQHAAFLEVSIANGSIILEGLMTVRSSKISNSKFLPFALAKLPDIIHFKVNTKPQTVPMVKLSMDMSEECVSTLLTDQNGFTMPTPDDRDLPSLWDQHADKNPWYNIHAYVSYYFSSGYDDYSGYDPASISDDNESDFSFYTAETYDKNYHHEDTLTSVNSQNENGHRGNTVNRSNLRGRARRSVGTYPATTQDDGNDHNDTEISNNATEGDDNYCFKKENNESFQEWHCNAGYGMPSEQKDMIMMALYATFFINLDTVTITRREIVPASDFEICTYTYYTRLYPEYLARLYAEYGLQQCCNLNMFQLEVIGGYSNTGIRQLHWECRNPYRITIMIEHFVMILSAVFTVFSPMAMKFFPSPHEVQHGNRTHAMQRVKLTTQFLHRNNTLKRTKRTRKCATQKPNSNSHVTIICDQQTYWENQDLIYMNGDAVFTFGLKTILSYALLFPFDNYPIRVLRRILSIFAVLSVGCVLLFARSVFFPFTLSNSYCKFEDCGYLMSYFTTNDYSYFMKYKVTSAVYVPALLTVVQVICLFPIIFKKQRLCEVLYWDEGNTALGQFMQQGKCLHSKYKSYSLETMLCKNFTTRLGYLVKRRFWVYLFDHFIFQTPQYTTPAFRKNKIAKFSNLLLTGIWYSVKMPLIIASVPLLILPIFTIWTGITNSPRKILGLFKRTSCFVCTIPLVILGYFMALVTTGFFIYMTTFTTIFIVIDIIRNIRASMPQMIFIASIMLYFRNAFVQFDDDFRELKMQVFQAMLSLEEEYEEVPENSEYHSLKNFPLRQDSNGDVAVPKSLFCKVSEEHMPYSKKVLKMLSTLCVHLTIVSFLFVVVVDFQVLDQFSELGESFVTVITVSLPSLFGLLYSDGQKTLEESKQFNRVRATLKTLIYDKQFWVEEQNKARRKTLACLSEDYV